MITLTVKGGALGGRSFVFTKPSIRIGGPGTDLDLSFDPWVSDLHCELNLAGTTFTVTDLGSANGTRVGSPSAVAIPPNVAVPIPPGADLIIGGQLLSITQPEVTPARRSGAIRSQRPGLASSRPASGPAHMTGPIPAVVRSSAAARRARGGGAGPGSGADSVVIEPLGPKDDAPEIYAEHEGRSCLLFVSGLHEGRAVFLGVLPVTIGRAESNQVALVDALVAPLHCTVTPVGGGAYELRPLSESTPVRVNGARITSPKRLEDEDLVGIGAHELRFLDARTVPAKDGAAPDKAIFALGGAVHRKAAVTIGKAAGADLMLPHARVEDRHARITWEESRFVLTDTSVAGVHVNGRRVVEHVLATGDVADVGGFTLAFEIQGRRLAARVTAPAETASVPQLAAAPEASVLGGIRPAASPTAHDTRGPKDRRRVSWKAPRDLRAKRRGRGVIALGAGTALLALLGIQRQGTGAFVDRPLAAPHAGPAFAGMAAAKLGGGGDGGCRACHANLGAAASERCVECHGKDAHLLRAGHVKALGAASCLGCHTEHLAKEGAPDLIAGAKCAACHEKRHQLLLPPEKGAVVALVPASDEVAARRAVFGVDLKADVAYTAAGKHRALHETHLLVEGSCTACHPKGADEQPERAYRACFGCHGPLPAEQALGAANQSCSDCHREHGPDRAWAQARSKPGAGAARAGNAVGWLALLLVPVGLFGLWRLRRDRSEAPPAEAPAPAPVEPALACTDGVPAAQARRLPVVIPGRCTGSGDCVAACPYGVLEMGPDRKPVPVKPDLCHECGTCVERCGPAALVLMVPGEPFPLVDRPVLDAAYETSADGSDGGVYVIGDAAAKPGIKHGINLGHAVVQHIAGRGLVPGAAQRLGCDVELIVVGSGPAGLSAALAAQDRGYSAIVFEQREVYAPTIHDLPPGKALQAVPPDVKKSGGLWLEGDTTREELLAKWAPAVARLNLRHGESVERMRHENGAFTITTPKGSYRGLRVVLAVGGRGEPKKLGRPGEDLPKVRYALGEPAAYAGKKVLVVGGGKTAVDAAVSLYRAGADVSLSFRQKHLVAPELVGLDVRLIPESSVVEVRERLVVLDRPPNEIENDVVVCLLGRTPTAAWLERLGIEVTKKSLSWEPP